jgi:hypothetical protein
MPPRRRWWLWGMVAALLRDPAPATYAGDWDNAWIAIRNRRGEQQGLFECRVSEAAEKRERVERELRDIPIDAWCQRYQVPREFVQA